MTRFLRNLLILNAVVALAVGFGGWKAGWTASTFAQVLGLVCIGAMGLGFAAFGGSGPSGVLSGGPGMGRSGTGAIADAVLAGAEADAAYGPQSRSGRGDSLSTWRARHGWRPGSHHAALLLLTTGVVNGVATFIVWSAQ